MNTVVVLGSAQLNADLQNHLSQTTTRHGERTAVLMLDKSDGVVERDEGFMQQVREVAIKEYFFGDARRTLSPFTLQVDFADVTIYKIPERKYPPNPNLLLALRCGKILMLSPLASEYISYEEALEKIDPVPEMAHWTLAVMGASQNVDEIRHQPIRGFVYVAEVDTDRKRLKILSPVSGRLGDQPLVWGRWPEPYINLLG